MEDWLKYLVCFILGCIIARMIGDGFTNSEKSECIYNDKNECLICTDNIGYIKDNCNEISIDDLPIDINDLMDIEELVKMMKKGLKQVQDFGIEKKLSNEIKRLNNLYTDIKPKIDDYNKIEYSNLYENYKAKMLTNEEYKDLWKLWMKYYWARVGGSYVDDPENLSEFNDYIIDKFGKPDIFYSTCKLVYAIDKYVGKTDPKTYNDIIKEIRNKDAK